MYWKVNAEKKKQLHENFKDLELDMVRNRYMHKSSDRQASDFYSAVGDLDLDL